MTTTPQPKLTGQLRRLWDASPPLLVSAVLTVLLGVFFLAGVFLDPRLATGAPVWLKPLKFALSISVYSFTLLWMLGFVRGRARLVRLLGWLVVLTFAAEWLAIIVQAARGTTSHFNVAMPFDTALWSLMGGAISLLWLTHLSVTVLVLRQQFASPAFAWALRLGLIVTLIGMALGFLMTVPSARQQAGWAAGGAVTIAGAHSVGVPDGGPGLPVVGWSTKGGDLRAPHFVGMHALQVLPLLGWLLTRRRNLSARQQTRLVWIGAGAYLGLMLLLAWQALRAQPITAPDSLTLGVLAALLGGAALSARLALMPRAPRPANV